MTRKSKILVLMVISMVLAYMPWYNFSAVLPFISKEFNLSAGDTGLILSVFQLGYVLVVLITGWLADRVGTKKVVAWATLFTAIFSTAFVWVARDFTTVLVMRLLTGLSAGAIYAPGMALLTNWFAPGERGKALGAYTGAMTAANAGGYFIASPLAAQYGWQAGILWTSLPVFVAAAIVFILVEEKPALDLSVGDDPPCLAPGTPLGPKPAPEGGYSGPALITTSYMGHMWELYAFWGWIGPFMVACASAVGYGSVEAATLGGKLAAFIILIGAPAVWLWGFAADKLGRRKAIIIGATCSLVAQFFFGYLYGHSLILVVLTGLWIGFWVIADSAVYKAGLTEMVSPNIRVTSLSVQSAAGFSMTILAPVAFGKVLEVVNGTTDPIAATNWGLPFLMLGVGALLAPTAAYLLKRTPQAGLMAGGEEYDKKD